eukprot:m.75993 g.75993  ORF g.75993 m.75993 type:complete len:95 (-) comp12472_c1_seq3:484-768(-)
MTRADSEAALVANGLMPGMFLVRPSSSFGAYSLSCVNAANELLHILIVRNEHNVYELDGRPLASTMKEVCLVGETQVFVARVDRILPLYSVMLW